MPVLTTPVMNRPSKAAFAASISRSMIWRERLMRALCGPGARAATGFRHGNFRPDSVVPGLYRTAARSAIAHRAGVFSALQAAHCADA
ncbi:hypothetical protein GCM10017782_02900 [Deinococcus ficus]|nr:hypothetical protein GCM10017782_02900 [Deinococcus ficus]